MKYYLLKTLYLVSMPFYLIAQNAPSIQWQNTIGGNNSDSYTSLRAMQDGGFILCGASASNFSADKSDSCRGILDYWIVKINYAGILEWDKTFGGNDLDVPNSIHTAKDGGYIVGGFSWSGISGDKTDSSNGVTDNWLLKLDSLGNIQWQKTFGGSSMDNLYALQQTQDGGFIIGGESLSGVSGDKTDTCRGGFDFWIIKTDSVGNITWQKTIGGNDFDQLASLQQTLDGGYILIGGSLSNASGDKTENCRGGYDYWIVKLDSAGSIQWQKTIGGNDAELPLSIKPTTDGGYIIGGDSYSYFSGDKTVNTNGGDDYWVIKIDSVGTIQWQQSYGGLQNDWCYSARQTTDGGYILGGTSASGISGNKTETLRGIDDYWIIKTDSIGNIQWQKTIGGSDFDELLSLEETKDGGYILGGQSSSPVSFEKTENCIGLCYWDYWIVKLDKPLGIFSLNQSESIFTIFPNPTKGEIKIEKPSPLKLDSFVTVYNSMGKIVLQHAIKTEKDLQLDLTKYGKGIYLVKVSEGGKENSSKVVVE